MNVWPPRSSMLVLKSRHLSFASGPYVRVGMDLYTRYAGFSPASKGSAMLSQSNHRSGGRRVCWTCSSVPVYCTCSSIGSISASHPTHIAMYTQCERICNSTTTLCMTYRRTALPRTTPCIRWFRTFRLRPGSKICLGPYKFSYISQKVDQAVIQVHQAVIIISYLLSPVLTVNTLWPIQTIVDVKVAQHLK